MSSIILFGAGASYGSLDVAPNPPPLGKDLFNALAADGGEAAGFSDDLVKIFQSDFEKGMAEYVIRSDGNTMRFQRELAGYLAKFRAGPKNVYLNLLRRVGIKRAVYVSLNYDLLFEMAAASLGIHTAYSNRSPSNMARLLKIHGSSNFWPDVAEGSFKNCTFSGNKIDVIAPIRPISQEQTLRRCFLEDSLAPAMAHYAVGKALKVSPAYVENQQRQWVESVESASQIFIIGVRVNQDDDHIWTYIGKSKASVTYFGRYPDKPDYEAWKANYGKKQAYFIEKPFSESVGLIAARLKV